MIMGGNKEKPKRPHKNVWDKLKKLLPNASFGVESSGKVVIHTNVTYDQGFIENELLESDMQSCPTRVFNTVPNLMLYDALSEQPVTFEELKVDPETYYACYHDCIKLKSGLTLGPEHRLVYVPSSIVA